MPASSATSSRRRPGVRREEVAGKTEALWGQATAPGTQEVADLAPLIVGHVAAPPN